MESGIWNLESGIWNLESGIWNLKIQNENESENSVQNSGIQNSRNSRKLEVEEVEKIQNPESDFMALPTHPPPFLSFLPSTNTHSTMRYSVCSVTQF